jgi:hypothetical protein
MYLETMSKNQTLLLKYNEINAHRNNLEIELEDLEAERDQLKVPRQPDLDLFFSQGTYEDMNTKVLLKLTQC